MNTHQVKINVDQHCIAEDIAWIIAEQLEERDLKVLSRWNSLMMVGLMLEIAFSNGDTGSKRLTIGDLDILAYVTQPKESR